MLVRALPWILLVAVTGCTRCPEQNADDDAADDDATPADDDDDADDDDAVDDDDDASDDDDTELSLPDGVTAILMEYDGEVDGADYFHEVVLEGAGFPLCGPQGETGITRFLLISDDALHGSHGGVNVRADGFDADSAASEQTLEAEVDGGEFVFVIPDKPDRPFSWTGGQCFTFVRTTNCPGVRCGHVICGTLEEPVINADGDWLWVYGQYQCME